MHVIHWARTGQGCTPVFPAKERNAELSRKSKIVRTGSTEAQDKNVAGLREVSFRPVYIWSAIKKAFYLCAVQRNP